MREIQRRAGRGLAAVACALMLVGLTGCGNFFVCAKASCTTSGGSGSTTTDYVYAANSSSGPTYINGYTLAKGTLASATGSPYPISVTTKAMAVSINDGFLYLATPSTLSSLAGIYGFSIGTGGALSVLSGGSALATQTSIAAMDVSPDGKWLIAASNNDGLNPSTVSVYGLNTSTGVFGTTTQQTLIYAPAALSTPTSIKVAPSGQFVALALGTGGVAVFPFNTSTGALSGPATITFTSGGVGTYDLAVDSNNYMYVASTGNVLVFAVSSAGVPGNSTVSSVATASGGPYSLALDGTSFLYAGASNGTNNVIYGYSIATGGKLTALSTATIASPLTTTRLAVDSTGKYLLASGYDASAGLKLYGIATSGVLTSLDNAPTGTSNAPTALAVTH